MFHVKRFPCIGGPRNYQVRIFDVGDELSNKLNAGASKKLIAIRHSRIDQIFSASRQFFGANAPSLGGLLGKL